MKRLISLLALALVIFGSPIAHAANKMPPPVPVKVSLRKAAMNDSYYALVTTLVKQNIPVIVTFKSQSTGAVKTKAFNVPWDKAIEIGYMQLAPLQMGDSIMFHCEGYRDTIFICTPSLLAPAKGKGGG